LIKRIADLPTAVRHAHSDPWHAGCSREYRWFFGLSHLGHAFAPDVDPLVAAGVPRAHTTQAAWRLHRR